MEAVYEVLWKRPAGYQGALAGRMPGCNHGSESCTRESVGERERERERGIRTREKMECKCGADLKRSNLLTRARLLQLSTRTLSLPFDLSLPFPADAARPPESLTTAAAALSICREKLRPIGLRSTRHLSAKTSCRGKDFPLSFPFLT